MELHTNLWEVRKQKLGAVISTKRLAGRTVVHVHADASPGADFERVEPDLEDVYFSTMAGHHRRNGATEVEQ